MIFWNDYYLELPLGYDSQGSDSGKGTIKIKCNNATSNGQPPVRGGTMKHIWYITGGPGEGSADGIVPNTVFVRESKPRSDQYIYHYPEYRGTGESRNFTILDTNGDRFVG